MNLQNRFDFGGSFITIKSGIPYPSVGTHVYRIHIVKISGQHNNFFKKLEFQHLGIAGGGEGCSDFLLFYVVEKNLDF